MGKKHEAELAELRNKLMEQNKKLDIEITNLKKLQQSGSLEAAKKLEEQIKKHELDEKKRATEIESIKKKAKQAEKNFSKEKLKHEEELKKLREEKSMAV